MKTTTSRSRQLRRRAVIPAALAASLVFAACGNDSGDGNGDAGTPAGDEGELPEDFTVGLANGGHGVDWMDGQVEVGKALAEQRGWDAFDLSNEGEGPKSVQNASQFVQEGVDVLLTFSGEISVNPAIAQTMEAADVPVITYDIDQEGWYFVGIDNQLAGQLGGEALGQLAQDQWDCDVDLVIRAEATGVGQVNAWRVDGMHEGLLSVCPDIAEDDIVSIETDGLEDVAQPAARDELAAHPDAENILVIGINDESVNGTLEAAAQLGRDGSIIGWGQGGSALGMEGVNENLAGSVFYFLEGYATYAFEAIVEPLAAGEDVPLKDSPDDPAVKVEPCLVSAEEAADIPSMEERIAALAEEEPGTHMNDLFCPAS